MQGFCERCHYWKSLEKHHKKLRKQGGSDKPINIAWVCRACHRAVHDCKGSWEMFRTKSFQPEGLTFEDYESELKGHSER